MRFEIKQAHMVDPKDLSEPVRTALNPDTNNCINDECEDANDVIRTPNDPSAVPPEMKSEDERAAEAARGRYTSESHEYARSNDTEAENQKFLRESQGERQD
jgi:hypothetical protein